MKTASLPKPLNNILKNSEKLLKRKLFKENVHSSLMKNKRMVSQILLTNKIINYSEFTLLKNFHLEYFFNIIILIKLRKPLMKPTE